MEKKRSGVLEVVCVLLYCVCKFCCVDCHGRTTEHIRAEPPSPVRSPEFRSKLERVMPSILLGSITGLVCALICACLVRFILRYIKRIPILKGPVVFSADISRKNLESALECRQQVVGDGKYYMTLLDNSLAIAVKKFEIDGERMRKLKTSVKRGIQRELEILASLRHRHVMRLRAYVSESDRFCLIYDWVPTGSLEDAMKRARENQLQLGWDARLRIAVGIIKGLQYLHFTRILHCNLKPANVMLDADFEPRLADCGLAKLIRTITSDGNGRPSVYSAPECSSNLSLYTEKSDIFNFGVILGILLTGKDPSDPLFAREANSRSGSGSGSGSDVGMWFRQVLEAGDAREALDKSLLGEEMEEDEMLMAVRIAAVCLSDMPADRPSSDELVPMLTQLNSF